MPKMGKRIGADVGPLHRARTAMECIRDLQARDDITGSILQVLHDGTDGIAVSRDENSFGIGLMLASST